MGCCSGGDPLSLELRMGRSQKGCCAGTLLPQAVLNHVDLVILSPTLKITGPTSIFALCPTAAFAARLYRLSSGCFVLVAGALFMLLSLRRWGFPNIMGTFLGVPIIRIILYWGLYWGPPILRNYHVFTQCRGVRSYTLNPKPWGSELRFWVLGVGRRPIGFGVAGFRDVPAPELCSFRGLGFRGVLGFRV